VGAPQIVRCGSPLFGLSVMSILQEGLIAGLSDDYHERHPATDPVTLSDSPRWRSPQPGSPARPGIVLAPTCGKDVSTTERQGRRSSFSGRPPPHGHGRRHGNNSTIDTQTDLPDKSSNFPLRLPHPHSTVLAVTGFATVGRLTPEKMACTRSVLFNTSFLSWASFWPRITVAPLPPTRSQRSRFRQRTSISE